MEQKAMAEELRALQRKGAQKLFAELAKWRNGFVPELGQKVADNWLKGAIAHLDENGILVSEDEPTSEVLERYLPGDSWLAFGRFYCWLDAKRGVLPWQIFMDDFTAERPAPRDVVLMMAIANGIGKAERLLDEKAASVTTGGSSTGGKRGPCHADAITFFRELRPACNSDDAAIREVCFKLRETTPKHRNIPSVRTVRRWLVEAGDIAQR